MLSKGKNANNWLNHTKFWSIYSTKA